MLKQDYIGHRRDTGEEIAFPVVWPDAADAERAWRWDAEHNPFPLTPLSQEFDTSGVTSGMAAQSLGAAATAPMPFLTANGYRYNGGTGGFGSRSPEYLETVAAMAPRIEELWDRGWRLEIEAKGRDIAQFDYDTLTFSQLVERLRSLVDDLRGNMVLMFQASHLVAFSRGQLLAFCTSHIGAAAESLVNDLLQGNPTVSLESGATLWDVAQKLAQNPDALEALHREPSAEGLAFLAEVKGAGEFVESFQAWLSKYGHRNGSFSELAEPTWVEDPRVAIGLVLQSIDSDDPRLSQQKAIDTRELLQREFEKRLRDPEVIGHFRRLLAAAGPYLGVRESRDHATNLALTSVRVPALLLGRRLFERGDINRVEDVFFLRFADLETAAAGSTDLRKLIAERRAEYEYWLNVSPPEAIGTTAPPYVDPRYVRGIAASSGVVTGKARVIMSLADAHTLQAGDILVTRATTPAWTPLFGAVSAVVTEGGGALSHCAILAREYGIPAVVGAPAATVRIRDGATITVDGTKGRVSLDV